MRVPATLSLPWLVLCLAFIATPAQASATPLPGPAQDFSCTGPVHSQAIALWEQIVRSNFTRQLQEDLNQGGDVYVLYNVQEMLQPFVEMTRRCKDRPQIAEVAEMLNLSFSSLRSLPDAPDVMGWVCTGGHTCTPVNKLLGKEVQLCSSQFLGLLGAVATNIVETIPARKRTPAEKSFLVNASSAMAVQVNHWLSPAYFAHVSERRKMTPESVEGSSSRYFFEDRDLWMMTTLSDLAELHHSGVTMSPEGTVAFRQLQGKSPQIAGMFDLFLARISMINAPGGQRAEIDRGYWRNYADTKYALYHGDLSPVVCSKDASGVMQKSVRIEGKPSYIDANIGWDISHARRLVSAMDTFVRNRSNLATVFSYRNPAFDPAKIQQAFARQITDKIWNQDAQYPLFSNFWDGSNGWYRVAYDNGTGRCDVGQPPYSLTWSFPTGAYPQWGKVNSTIQSLGQRIYLLLHATDAESKAFVSKHYPQLELSDKTDEYRDIWLMAFQSSLVGNSL